MARIQKGRGRRALRRVLVALGASGMTLLFFLVLPLIQAISQTAQPDTDVRRMDGVEEPPPPPPIEEEPPEEEEPEEPPPQMEPDTTPLDLADLELALDPGTGGEGFLGGDFANRLLPSAAQGDADDLFSLADLDQAPQAIYQPMPMPTPETRKKAPGQVFVLFEVDANGRVVNPTVQTSTDPVFERPALSAVRQWKFEPGRRKGQAVRFRMRVPITFPKS